MQDLESDCDYILAKIDLMLKNNAWTHFFNPANGFNPLPAGSTLIYYSATANCLPAYCFCRNTVSILIGV